MLRYYADIATSDYIQLLSFEAKFVLIKCDSVTRDRSSQSGDAAFWSKSVAVSGPLFTTRVPLQLTVGGLERLTVVIQR